MGITAMEEMRLNSEVGRLLGLYMQGGRVGEASGKSLIEKGIAAADPLLRRYRGEVHGGDFRIAEIMVEIAAKNPAEPKSTEMMEAVGKHLKKKKRGDVCSEEKQNKGRVVALKRRHTEVARLMGMGTGAKSMHPPKGGNKRERKKAARAANNLRR